MLATETGVWTTSTLNSDGVTWAQETNGMPNVRVDMLRLRASDNTVLASTHGRGLFTAIWDVIQGVNNIQKSDVSIYPNPTSGILNISCTTAGIRQLLVKIYDQAGKVVLETSTNSANGNFMDQVNMDGNPDGIYIVALYEDGRNLKTLKIIKR